MIEELIEKLKLLRKTRKAMREGEYLVEVPIEVVNEVIEVLTRMEQ